jgi:sugar lactone lactonase YvrE
VAGNGRTGSLGDYGPATNAELGVPYDVAVDSAGNLYIADAFNYRVRRVDTTGIITTYAGTGTGGFSGDNAVASSAQINNAFGLTVDGVGNLYIADSYNYRVRRVDTNGNITTVAGTGTQGYSGDNIAAVSAQLNYPTGLAVDYLGNIYVADTSSHRIRQIDNTGIIKTVAGTGTAGELGDNSEATNVQLNRLNGVELDSFGNLYIADPDSQRVRSVDNTGIITTIAGTGTRGYMGDGGAATSAQLANPTAVKADIFGNLFIVDTSNHCIRRVDRNGAITTVAGTGSEGYGGDNGVAMNAQLAFPTNIALDGVGNLYIADTGNHRIRRVDINGIISTVAGTGTRGYSGDNNAATNARLNYPYAVTADQLGNLYIADTLNHVIRKVDSNGQITTIAGMGFGGFSGDNGPALSARLSNPWSVAVDGLNNLYIADTQSHRIRRVDTNGIITTVAGTGIAGNSGDGGAATSAQLSGPRDVALDAMGSLYVADTQNSIVRRIDRNGTIVTVAGGKHLSGATRSTRIENVVALSLAPTGTTYIATGVNGAVARVIKGKMTQVAGRYSSDTTQATGNLARFRDRNFGSVGGVAWDESAQLLYLTESSATSSRVWAVTPVDPDNPDTWTIEALVNDSGTAGFADGASTTAMLRNPTALWLDAATRTLYIADTGNHAIRALDLSTKTVTTVVNAKHSLGFAGDGAAATAALLYQPQALTKCANGDLFIADTGNNRIRRVAAGTGLRPCRPHHWQV